MSEIKSTKDTREYIWELCDKHGINKNIFLIGFGTKYTFSKNRYEYNVGDGLTNNPEAKLAVKYFKQGDFFITWIIKKT